MKIDLTGKRAIVNGESVELTARECTVLDTLLRRAGRVVSKQVLFDAVFSFDTDAAPNALEVQVSRLRNKLKSSDVTIRALRGLGYRIEQTQHARGDIGDGDGN